MAAELNRGNPTQKQTKSGDAGQNNLQMELITWCNLPRVAGIQCRKHTFVLFCVQLYCFFFYLKKTQDLLPGGYFVIPLTTSKHKASGDRKEMKY